MARLKKNGNLSGAIGNIVFVNDGERAYVRAKVNNPNQTQNTKIEADKFKLAGLKEKQFRDILTDKIGLVSHQYQAVRHKSRLLKTISKQVTESGNAIFKFENPEAMTGFDFNPKMEWDHCTNLYPKYKVSEEGVMKISIPKITWGEQIKPPRKATTATLSLYALAVDFNKKLVAVDILASLPQTIAEREKIPEQNWTFEVPKDERWLFIIALLDFESSKAELSKTEKTAGTYLYAQSITP